MPIQPRRTPLPVPAAALALRAPVLSAVDWLVHGFSTRLGGVSAIPHSRWRAELNLGHQPWDSAANVAENRRRFLDCLRAGAMRLVLQEQIHSDLIHTVRSLPNGAPARRGDGLITDRPQLLLGVLTADCLPVLVADVRRRVVAALHCGWRGTLKRIAQKGVGRMRQLFGSRPEDLRAALGPGIRACCYRVGEEVAAEYESQFLYADRLLRIHKPHKYFVNKTYALMRSEPWRGSASGEGRHYYLDLVEANLRQLLEAGVERANIYAEAPCVSCHPELFFSHRRDAGCTGRMLGVIGIRP